MTAPSRVTRFGLAGRCEARQGMPGIHSLSDLRLELLQLRLLRGGQPFPSPLSDEIDPAGIVGGHAELTHRYASDPGSSAHRHNT